MAHWKMSKHVSRVDKALHDSEFQTVLTVAHNTKYILHCNPAPTYINMYINNLKNSWKNCYFTISNCIIFSILLQSISFGHNLTNWFHNVVMSYKLQFEKHFCVIWPPSSGHQTMPNLHSFLHGQATSPFICSPPNL